jgi:(p)ppGpp synthase/HD superfamily hydrolase
MRVDIKTVLSERFEEALVYAAQLHVNQRRKVRNTPYVAHLLSVAALVLEDGGDEDEAIAALLHDAVEDQGGENTRTEIRRRFGERVAAIVDGCTEPERVGNQSWREHKLAYLEQIRQASTSVQRVMLADKLHNARSLWVNLYLEGDRVWTEFRGSRSDVLWLQQAQVRVFEELQSSRWMVAELRRVVNCMDDSIYGNG